MYILRLLTTASLMSVALAAPAWAEKMTFTADLSAANEVPPADSTATGKAEATFDSDTKQLTWIATADGLTGEATAAHFHGPAPEDQNAGPMVALEDLSSPMEGSATLTDDQVKALTDGQMYFNVHTAKFPDGEIRGQMKKM
jgi:hypothetical protein